MLTHADVGKLACIGAEKHALPNKYSARHHAKGSSMVHRLPKLQNYAPYLADACAEIRLKFSLIHVPA